MDKPLTTWYCDNCGKEVSLDDGYVIWRCDANDKFKEGDFRIIHQSICDNDNYENSLPLADFTGADGMLYLLSWLSLGPALKRHGHYRKIKDIDEYVDFFRRVQLPYYEEARKSFDNPEIAEYLKSTNEVSPYLQKSLKDIIAGVGIE